MWWAEQFPGIDILYAKKDVKGAFRIIWVRDKDVFIMAVEIPGDALRLPGKTVTVATLYPNGAKIYEHVFGNLETQQV